MADSDLPITAMEEDLPPVNMAEDLVIEENTLEPRPMSEPMGQQYFQDVHEMTELQKTFSAVIADYERDGSVDKILSEYHKLYQALVESHSKQRKYMLMVSSLQCDIKNNEEKVNMALHLSQEDKEIIKNLTRQANQAWFEAELMTVKENRARTVITKLQDGISSMMALVETGTGLQELQQVAQTAVSERKDLEEALVSMKEELDFKEVKIQELNERSNAKEEGMLRDIDAMKERVLSFDKKKNEMQKRILDQEEQIQTLERWRGNLASENTVNINEIDNLKTKITRFETVESDLRAEVMRIQQLYNEQIEVTAEKSKEVSRLLADLEIQKKKIKILNYNVAVQKEKLEEKDNEVKVLEKNCRKKEGEVEVLIKKIDMVSTNLKTIQNDIILKDSDLKEQKEKIQTLILSISECYAKGVALKEDAERMKRQADLVNQKNVKLVSKKGELEEKLNLREKNFISLFKELNDVALQLKKTLEKVSSLEYEKERLYGVINKILEAINRLATENEGKESRLLTLLKVNKEQESYISNINTKLFRMTNQRDNIANELHLIQLRNDELNLANINFNKQITSLAEDLHHKEQELEKKVNKNNILNNEIHSLQSEIVTWQEEVGKRQKKITELEGMIRSVDKVLCKKELQIGQLRLTIDQVVTQRNLLGYQCIKKKELIHFLTEKTTLMNNVFNMGNLAYKQQTDLIAQLRKKISSLIHQKNYVMHRLENVNNYKSKLGLANQSLVKALARNLAIEGEHPNNLHRWKHLKAADISQYEMVLKIHYLLKRVIVKTDEVTRLEGVIFNKNAFIQELKYKLEMRPGPEMVLKAKITEKEKEKLNRKLKAAVAERNMCYTQNDKFVIQNRCLVAELIIEKKKTLKCNKSNILLKDKLSKLPKIQNGTLGQF